MPDVSDHIAIRALLDRYLLAIDTHETAPFVALFWDDGVYVSPFGAAEGRAAIAQTIEQWHGGGMTAGKRHMSGPAAIDIRGDEARVISSYWVAETAVAPPRVVATGGYVDVLQKRDGEWRLLRREQTVDPAFRMEG